MSCLFDSLGRAIGKDGLKLRTEICDFLETDPILYDDVRVSSLLDDPETPSSLQEYVDAMRSPETWGSALEIECFCRMYSRRVVVKMIPTNTETRFGSFRSRYPDIYLEWTGGHYENYES